MHHVQLRAACFGTVHSPFVFTLLCTLGIPSPQHSQPPPSGSAWVRAVECDLPPPDPCIHRPSAAPTVCAVLMGAAAALGRGSSTFRMGNVLSH